MVEWSVVPSDYVSEVLFADDGDAESLPAGVPLATHLLDSTINALDPVCATLTVQASRLRRANAVYALLASAFSLCWPCSLSVGVRSGRRFRASSVFLWRRIQKFTSRCEVQCTVYSSIIFVPLCGPMCTSRPPS